MKLEGIIFDGDGVLFDTENLHVIAWKKIFPEYNINLNSEDFEEGIGVEDTIFLKNMKIKGKIPENLSIKDMVSRKNEELIKILDITDLKISDEIVKILNYLKGRYKIALASNSQKNFVLKVLKKLGIERFFDAIVTRDDVKNPKPDPEIYKIASERLNIKEENLIAFEDSETGIISAKSSGIFCVGITSTLPFEKLKMADIIINELNMENLKKVIKIFEEKNEN